jgi:peptidoglycan/LPS O-acetylase OafA/YrhL
LIQYRKDIDGLRALAVLPVVLFHAGFGVPGGFVGVDVFFVISGYLITSLISEEMQTGKFSIAAFYERRIRRIFPALFAMMTVSAILAWFFFMPPDFALFGKSVLSAALFVSNILFRREAGYFDTSELMKPLLHTWSLAVEEQFYIFFPLILFVFRSRQSFQFAVIVLLAAISLGLSEWWVIKEPTEAFYLLPSRFWELGLGGLLSYLPRYRPQRTAIATAITASGVLLIGIAIFAIHSTSPFPGLLALVPCGGAALVIFGGSVANPASRLLGSPPLAFIGLISYSLYLWHWPLIVFSQYELGHALSPAQAICIVTLSIVVSVASWKFIETPFRRRAVLSRRFNLFGFGAAAMAVAFLAGFSIDNLDGFPGRLSAEVARIYSAKADVGKYMAWTCLSDNEPRGPSVADVRAGRLCTLGNENAADISFAVWGDSHAAAMAPAIDKIAAEYNRKGLFIGQAGCPPLLQYETPHARKTSRDSCLRQNEAAADLLKSKHMSMVFLIARWPREVLGAQYGNEGPFFDPAEPYKVDDRSAEVAEGLDKTLTLLAQLHIRAILVMDVPEPGYDVPYALARAAKEHRQVDINPPRSVVDQRQRQSMAVLRAASAKYGVELVDPTPSFCSADRCNVAIDGRPLYVDSNHLTKTEAMGLSGLFAHSFNISGAAGLVGGQPGTGTP